jgi:hypothetical protein
LEHRADTNGSTFVAFFKDADLLIFDAQYSLAEAEPVKRDWGPTLRGSSWRCLPA